jgi:hypothetical protein
MPRAGLIVAEATAEKVSAASAAAARQRMSC